MGANNLHIAFGSFSILLAIAIFASIPLMKRTHFKKDLHTKDLLLLPFIGFLGGIITAWLSVGVGELVAVYLIIRGFNVTLSNCQRGYLVGFYCVVCIAISRFYKRVCGMAGCFVCWGRCNSRWNDCKVCCFSIFGSASKTFFRYLGTNFRCYKFTYSLSHERATVKSSARCNLKPKVTRRRTRFFF